MADYSEIDAEIAASKSPRPEDRYAYLDTEVQAQQVPDAPVHPERIAPQPAVTQDPGLGWEPEPPPTAQGIAKIATAPGRIAERMGGQWARQIPTKFGMEEAPEGSTVEKVGKIGGRMIGDTPLFAAGAALAPEIAGAGVIARYGRAGLQGAAGMGVLQTFEDMAEKGEIDLKDVGRAALEGFGLGTAFHGGTEAIGALMRSKAGQAAGRIFSALDNRIEHTVNKLDYMIRNRYGIEQTQELGLLPPQYVDEYMAGKIDRRTLISKASKANKERFAQEVASRGLKPDTTESVQEAVRPMVEAGLPEDEAWAMAEDAIAKATPPLPEPVMAPVETPTAPEVPVSQEAPPTVAPEAQAAMEKTGITDPELAMALVTPPATPVVVEPPAGEGDLSFFEEAGPATEGDNIEAMREADKRLHEMGPKEIARRFPDASPEAIKSVGAASLEAMKAARFKPTEVEGTTVRGARGGAVPDQSRIMLPPMRVRPPEMVPAEIAATIQAAGLKTGGETPLIRAISDPVFGKIQKGEKVIIRGMDMEGGNAIIEWGTTDARTHAIVPISALAKPVRASARVELNPSEVKPRVKEVTGLADTSPKISTTEREQLKLVLKSQEHGATKARLAVERKARADIRDLMRTHSVEGKWAEGERRLVDEIEQAKAKEYKARELAIRDKVAKYAKAVLPPKERWAFMNKVAKAKTPEDLAVAINAIDERANEVFNKGRIKDIQTQVERLLNSPSFPEEVKAMVRELFKEINLDNRSKATIDRLVRLQSFVDRVKSQGGDVEIPQAITDRLKRLANRNLKDMEPEEVEAIYTALKRLEVMGKGLREARQVMEEVEIDMSLSAIEEQGLKTQSPTPVTRGQGQASLSWVTKQKNKLIALTDFANSIGRALRPNQVIVDQFGPEFRTQLMNPLDDAYTAHEAEYGNAVGFVEDLVKKHGIPTEQRQDAITTVLMREQGEAGINKLKQLGMTREQIDAEVLSESERAIADALRGYLNDPARVARLKAVDELVYNQQFEEVKNRWPMKTDFGVKGEPLVHGPGSDVVDILKSAIDSRRKNVDVGQLQKRKLDAKQIIRRDIFGVFLDDIRQGSAITNMAETLLRTKKIIQDPRFSAAAGDVPYDFFNDLIDLLARDGKFPKTKFEVAAAVVRRNLATAYLWGMPHVGMLQMSMLSNAAGVVGTENIASALRAGPEWTAFVAEHMPRVRLIKGGDISVHEVLDGKLLPGLKEGGFKHIVAANHYAAERTAIAAYMRYAQEHGIEIDLSKPNQDALRWAQQVVGKSGATPWLIDMPMGLSRGNITGRKGLDSLLLQFQSDQLAKGGLIYEAAVGKAGEGERASRLAWLGASVVYESGVKFAWSAMVSAIMFGMGIISKKEYEKRKEKNKYWKSVALNSLDGVPALGQASRMIAYGSSGIPVLDAGMNLGKAIKAQKLVATLGSIAAMSGMPLSGIVTRMAVAGIKSSNEKYRKTPAGRSEARRKARARARSRR